MLYAEEDMFMYVANIKHHSLSLCYPIIKEGASGDPSGRGANHTPARFLFLFNCFLVCFFYISLFFASLLV